MNLVLSKLIRMQKIRCLDESKTKQVVSGEREGKERPVFSHSSPLFFFSPGFPGVTTVSETANSGHL